MAYRALFQETLEASMPTAIRESMNKAWVLGDEGFVEAITTSLKRRSAPMARGGDHRSLAYRERKL